MFATDKGSAATKVKKAVLINFIILFKYTSSVLKIRVSILLVVKKKLFLEIRLEMNLITGN